MSAEMHDVSSSEAKHEFHVIVCETYLWNEEFYLLGYNAVHSALLDFACCLLHAGFLLGLFFDPEEGGDMRPTIIPLLGVYSLPR
jgi:hypothetical protein